MSEIKHKLAVPLSLLAGIKVTTQPGMTEAEAKEIVEKGLDELYYGPSLTFGFAKGVLHGIAIERERAKPLLKALNKIASWGEGEKVSGNFDEPNSAQVARDAIIAYRAKEG